MEIGISTASFFSKETTEDSLKIISDMDIKVCEVFLTTFREYRKEFVDELVRRKDSGLEVYSIHSLNQHFEPELFNLVARTREDAEFYFREMVYAAKALEAKIYTFHGPAKLKKRPYVHNYQWLGQRLRDLNAELSVLGGGCQIAYENVHWTFFDDVDFFNNLKKECDVKACLDIKQAMQSKVDVYSYIDCMGDRLANVHLCDYFDNGKLAMPGKGIFDFVSLFKRLKDIGYDGPLLMEVYAGDYQNYSEITESIDYLKNCLAKI